jgi:ubiquinone/menaquinone biosynthesis C-methylase UbiE
VRDTHRGNPPVKEINMDDGVSAETARSNVTAGGFIPALRFGVLTPAYDMIVRLTTRERTVKRVLLEAADLDRAVRLLDIGCGTGTFVIAAKRQYPHLDVVGIDPDPVVLARAREKARRAQVDVMFLGGCATELPARDAAFDRVTSSLVFHHLTAEQKRRAACEVGRVLSEGGEFHMADWVQPANVLMRVLFWSVQLLDGIETTRDHAQGRLIELLASGGLADVVQQRSFATPAGTVGLISARPAAASRTARSAVAG